MRNKISEYIVDETLIKVGSKFTWFWVAIEPEKGQILALSISNDRNMLIAETLSVKTSQRLWKTYSFYRWWNMIPNGL